MRNQYPGTCYRCGEHVAAGEGHFERLGSKWRVQHAACAIEHRGQPDAERMEHQARMNLIRAKGTGKAAQRARKRLRDGGVQSQGAKS
jgi:hypothetical protein